MNAIISSRTRDIVSRLHAPFGLLATLDALMTANPMCLYPSGIGSVSMRYSASSARKVVRASLESAHLSTPPLFTLLRLAENSRTAMVTSWSNTHRTWLVITLIDHQNVLLPGA